MKLWKLRFLLERLQWKAVKLVPLRLRLRIYRLYRWMDYYRALKYFLKTFEYNGVTATVEEVKISRWGIEFTMRAWVRGKRYDFTVHYNYPDEPYVTDDEETVPVWVNSLLREIFEEKLYGTLDRLCREGKLRDWDVDEGEYEPFCGKDSGTVLLFLKLPNGREVMKHVYFVGDYEKVDVDVGSLDVLEGYEGMPL